MSCSFRCPQGTQGRHLVRSGASWVCLPAGSERMDWDPGPGTDPMSAPRRGDPLRGGSRLQPLPCSLGPRGTHLPHEKGREFAILLIRPGEVFGALALIGRSFEPDTARARIPSEVCFFPPPARVADSLLQLARASGRRVDQGFGLVSERAASAVRSWPSRESPAWMKAGRAEGEMGLPGRKVSFSGFTKRPSLMMR